jgi:hypothetical protein
MDNLKAILTIEQDENASDEEQLRAWQHLIDNELVWCLQGWYGRGAMALINAGLCSRPAQEQSVCEG